MRPRANANSVPRELTVQDVRDLRAKKLGYGEISILLALTAKQANAATAKSLNEILAMRQSREGGWGKLARALGYKNLGSVVKSVRATEKDVTKVAMERSEKPDKSGKMDKPRRSWSGFSFQPHRPPWSSTATRLAAFMESAHTAARIQARTGATA